MNLPKYIVWMSMMLLSTGLKSQIFKSTDATVHFSSDAPLELIEAKSDRLQGVIDLSKNAFAFKIDMKSFEGFNSRLQREHFNENYMETREFPHATFTGKIIEKVDFSKDGIYEIRAKGQLEIHGVKQERIIKSTMQIKEGIFVVQSNFSILLKEHNISIPKIVHQKIAEEIKVTVKSTFEKTNL